MKIYEKRSGAVSVLKRYAEEKKKVVGYRLQDTELAISKLRTTNHTNLRSLG